MDLSQLSQQDLEQLRQLLGIQEGDNTGRSIIRFGKDRQLHDLNLKPTATDPRPLFVWSAEPPRDHALVPPPYRRLMWEPISGAEICVKSESEFRAKEAAGYLSANPKAVITDPQQELADLMAQLSPEDRQYLEETMRKNKMAAIEERIAALSPAAYADVLDRAGEPAKRGPGRPKKEHVA